MISFAFRGIGTAHAATTERSSVLDAVKDAMLTAVSHEVRTPLSIVVGLAETLQNPKIVADPALVQVLVGRLDVQARRLADLLTDLMDLDRLKRGVVEPSRREVDLMSLARSACEDLDLHSHPIHMDADPVVASVDAAQFTRIVENLVTNAQRHTPAGTSIWIHVESTLESIVLTVADAGPGIPDEIKGDVFKVFYRGDRKDHDPGAGIGLPLVARMAELHGGRAWVTDRPGGGAAFHVELPAQPTRTVTLVNV